MTEQLINIISDTRKDLAVMANEQKHMQSAITELTKLVTRLGEKVEVHATKLSDIYKERTYRGKIYNFICNNWWKLALAIIAIDNAYDLVKTIPKH